MMNKLREATAQLHREIEKDNLAGRIISHDISLEEYKLLLLQNYVAYAVTEGALEKNLKNYRGDKAKRLEQDLFNLGLDTSIANEFSNKFSLSNRAEALGAAYVVEGSSLGGMLIAKELENCNALSSVVSHSFFNGDRNNIKSWNSFSKSIKQEKFTPQEETMAIAKAKETFLFFGEVFSTVQLES
ncbi:biliverdin-producing heme oxygenase [Antarcticibacterium arcticum]|uniref:Biliverdin-producing heme oxygenase n=1 Tax=Antarcticibacterium arcticum TaxID=2585771 RepID=A0A5B8YF71_9FLAO|nr:biliverdin-producing heme oxygenase [Antarcticibacterium arcticum]QED36570.1 biliverdin-producing heme oxygenase [Antarcticibacterium arcticum]